MFNPKYIITDRLLENIKKISFLVFELNSFRFSRPVLVEIGKNSEVISTFASTSIEGNPLPLTDVKQVLKQRPENVSDSVQEVLNYNQILKEINKKLGKGFLSVNLNSILHIHKKITKKLMPLYRSGKFRQEAVFVRDPRTGKTVYWPPDDKDVPRLMKELMEFVRVSKNNIDPLIVAGIFHKQMVVIHPFTDGNGRTTRILTKVLLAQMGLNTFNLFSFENYYNKNVTKYFDKVGVKGNYYEVADKIDFTGWLEYFTEGIIDELLRVKKLLPTTNVRQVELKPHHKKILDSINKRGFITDSIYAKLVKRARATRYLDFEKLIALGLIVRRGKSKSTYYIFKQK